MSKLVAFLIVLVFSLFIFSCNSATWTQYQGNGLNDGFTFVSTAPPTLQPKWSLNLEAPDNYSSPVIGGMTANGSKAIYLGVQRNIRERFVGELVAVRPDGTIKWRTTFPNSFFLTTPSVGNDGNIYAISNRRFDGEDTFRSVVYSVSPADGQILWGSLLRLGTYTFTSLKTWGFGSNLSIFASDQQTLYVFDRAGDVIATAPLCRDVVNLPIPLIPDTYPTPAVANTRRSSNPIVVIGSWHCLLQAFEWNFTERKLEPLWAQRLESLLSSPAVLVPAALVVVGTETGLSAYDLYTGEEQWSYRANNPPVFATPASLLGINIYFRDTQFLYELNSNGELLYRVEHKQEFLPPTSSPVVTANHVYLNTRGGLQGYSLDLSDVQISLAGGYTSPAVDDDGTIYIMTNPFREMGRLQAYPGS